MIRRFQAVILLLPLMLACSLGGAASATLAPVTSVTPLPTGGDLPKVVIEAPTDKSQAVVGQPFEIRVHATDGIGITRVEMLESGRLVATQPLPDPDPNPTVRLVYKPTNIGPLTLQIIALRQSVASDPVSITIDVVASVAQLSNPNALDSTSGFAAGAICTIRATVSNLNLRGGPGTNFARVANLSISEDLNVIGRNSDSSWFEVKRGSSIPANLALGWVSSTYTAPNDGCDKAPVVTPTANS